MPPYNPDWLKARTDASANPYPTRPFAGWPGSVGHPTVPAAARLPYVNLQHPASRPSYDLSGILPFLGHFAKIPQRANLSLYSELREAVPVINRAIVALRQLVGCPRIVASDPVKEELERWMAGVSVNRTQTGFENWVSTHLDDMLCFGRAHAEIVLTNSRDEVAQLLEVDPLTTTFRPDGDNEHVHVVQYQAMAPLGPVTLNPDLVINSVYDVRRDDPFGTSLIFGLPLVSEIYTRMLKALGATWTRFGSPRWHINWEPPEGWDDPDAQHSTQIMRGLQSQFDSGLQASQDGLIQDFYTSGKVSVSILGAQGEELVFDAPAGALIEQIVCATGLPPMLLGLQSVRETMATVQALLLTETIESLRGVITPGLTRLIDLRQRVAGKSRKFSLEWDDPTVQDRYEDAHADYMEEQARQFELANDAELWRWGIYDRLHVARKWRPDLANIDDEALLAMLPDLVDVPPEAPKPVAGAGPGQGPAGSQSPTPSPNPGPRERTYALAARNGNGKH